MKEAPRGVVPAAATPFAADGSPDAALLAAHCTDLLDRGAAAVLLLGTAGEFPSLTVEERLRLAEDVVAAGVDPDRLIVGTTCCALPDTVRLTRHALGLGVRGVLVAPPFYYRDVPDSGVAATYARLIETVGDRRLALYLYHFPAMTGVPVKTPVVERLLADYPGTVAGIKDSGGDLSRTRLLVRAFPGLAVYTGSERFLRRLVRTGGAGGVSLAANLLPGTAARVCADPDGADGIAAQRGLDAVAAEIKAHPQVPALKEALARSTGQAGWRRLRPPLAPLEAAAGARLADRLRIAGAKASAA